MLGPLRLWHKAPTWVPAGAPVLASETLSQIPLNEVRTEEPPLPAAALMMPKLAACATELEAAGATTSEAIDDCPTKVAVNDAIPTVAPMAFTEQEPEEREHSGRDSITLVLLTLKLTSPVAVEGVTVAVHASDAPTLTVGEQLTLRLRLLRATTVRP